MAGRKTLDIDYITLRNMRTVNPANNLSPTANYILACDGSGTANWVNTITNIESYGINILPMSYTMYLGYTPSVNGSINKLYIPPFLFSAAHLRNGAVLTENDPSGYVTFYGLDSIDCSGLTLPFVTSFSVSGYNSAGRWAPAAPGGYGVYGGTGLTYQTSSDYKVTIKYLGLQNINGANTSVLPTSGKAAGYLATVTLNFG